MNAIVIGGTRFIGRHTVEELLAHDYRVTLVNRARHENPFSDHTKVRHVQGNRNNRETLERACDATSADVVIDCIAMAPQQVATVTDVFVDIEAYVLVSSTAAYARPDLPRREEETPLHTVDKPAEIKPDDSTAYGPRKAECDRACFAAADNGTNAFVVRPTFVFGPYDYTQRFDYWIERVANYDRVLVPGDNDAIVHHVYVKDVARALRIVAENGIPGEAYNVGARQLITLDERLKHVAKMLDTDIELVHASDRELAQYNIEKDDFPLVWASPVIIDTAKIAGLEWESTPHADAISCTVDDHLKSDRTGRHQGPNREMERQAIEGFTSNSDRSSR